MQGSGADYVGRKHTDHIPDCHFEELVGRHSASVDIDPAAAGIQVVEPVVGTPAVVDKRPGQAVGRQAAAVDSRPAVHSGKGNIAGSSPVDSLYCPKLVLLGPKARVLRYSC